MVHHLKEKFQNQPENLFTSALLNLGYEVIVNRSCLWNKSTLEVEKYFSEKDYTEISNENYLDAINLISSMK